jgi:hypothetical protein
MTGLILLSFPFPCITHFLLFPILRLIVSLLMLTVRSKMSALQPYPGAPPREGGVISANARDIDMDWLDE